MDTPQPARPPGGGAARLVLLAVLAFLAVAPLSIGCSGSVASGPPAGAARSLLASVPQSVELPRGVLVPTLRDQWGTEGTAGWNRDTGVRGGHDYVWSVAPKCLVTLEADAPRDRSLRIRMWCPSAPEGKPDEQACEVRLNGALVGEAEIDDRPRTFTFPTPADAWREGNNFLELEVAALRTSKSGWRFGVGVSRIAWESVGVPLADTESEALVLTSGSSVTHAIEPLGEALVRVGAKAAGPGELELEFLETDPVRGATIRSLSTWSVNSTGGAVERELPVPSPERGVLRLRLAWTSPEGAALDVSRLDVVEMDRHERFPIVIIAVDTLAAQNISAYGYERETTPNLDRLAKGAVLFEHCVTNAPWTLPSFMSLVSGLYAECNRVPRADRGPKLWEMWNLADGRWLLPEALTAAGWTCAGFVDSPWLTERYGFTQGFGHFDARAGDFQTFPRADPEGGVRFVTRAALEWIDEQESRSWFTFVHCIDPHGPYAADEEFTGRFRDDLASEGDLRPAGAVSNAFETIPAYITAMEYPEHATPEVLPTAPIVAAYDEGVAMTDAVLGRFLDDLEERGILDDALVVVMADHGETMADDELLFGHAVLDEPCTHVPLIVKLPGQSVGRRVPQTVQIVDLYPTLLELAGIRRGGRALHGRSLVPLLHGETLPEVPTLTESGIMTQSAVYHDGWKLVVRRPGDGMGAPGILTFPDEHHELVLERFPILRRRPLTDALLQALKEEDGFGELEDELNAARSEPLVSLYRIRDDPGETRDLAAEHPDRVAEMTRMLEELQVKRDRDASTEGPRHRVELSAEELEELRGLGYTGD